MASQELKSSSERIGQLYPILVDYFGKIIDGEHRFGVDQNWRTVKLGNIKTEKDRLIVRIVCNTVRRSVSDMEKRELLCRLGELYLDEGIEPGKIAHKIAYETGMSYQWVMKYLPDRFKDRLQSERAKPAIRRRAKMSKLLEPPEDVVRIAVYKNTSFVNLIVKKPLYKKLEEKAKKLETTPSKLIYNALLLILRT